MNQTFSPEQTIRLLRKYELTEYKTTKDKLLIELTEAFEKIADNSFEFSLSKHKKYLAIGDLVGKLILRKLNDNIKRLYKDKQANRRMIIFQIKTLLEDECPLWLYRTDIASFYPSIDGNRLIEKLRSDSMLSYFSLNLLEKLFQHPYVVDQYGLPLGIPISATLSELFMRRFDEWMRSSNGTYYYARFVDDIIAFNFKKEAVEDLDKKVEFRLALDGLKKSAIKTHKYDGRQLPKRKPLEFLGYQFFHDASKKKSEKIAISIATSKVKKIKSRIILSFIDFIKTKDKILLENRIRFLTGNYVIRTDNEGSRLKAGIFYNYSLVDDFSVLDELDIFYKKALHCKRFSLGKKLSPLMDAPLKAVLTKYSFKHGFQNKVTFNFTQKAIKKISSCW